jgi:hypothetical protein
MVAGPMTFFWDFMRGLKGEAIPVDRNVISEATEPRVSCFR